MSAYCWAERRELHIDVSVWLDLTKLKKKKVLVSGFEKNKNQCLFFFFFFLI